MTFLPLDDRNVVGVEGPKPQLGPLCAHPFCNRPWEEKHHLWRRSFLAGAFDWVRLPDGQVVCNVVGLCLIHHGMITVNDARITYVPQTGLLMWHSPGAEGRLDGQGDWHDVSSKGHDYSSHDSSICPTCHQRVKPKIENKPEERKPRGSWSITVPKDVREDGADVLDSLLENARISLDLAGISYGPERKVRYYVLAASLGLFVQHFEELMSDG